MHVAGKVFLGLGVAMLLIGGIMTAMGGDSLNELEWDIEGESVFEGPDGVWTHDKADLMIFYVDDTVDCESFNIIFTNETGDTGYDTDPNTDSDGDNDTANDNDRPFFEKEDCAEDGMSMSSGDDPDGFYSIGVLAEKAEWGDYEVNATGSFYTVPLGATAIGVAVDAAGGFAAMAGGLGLAGCGICSLVLGGVLALVLKDPQPTVVMQQNQ